MTDEVEYDYEGLESLSLDLEDAKQEKELALAQRNQVLKHFKEALNPMFDSNPPWNKLRRYLAWAIRASHPGLNWPTEAETKEILSPDALD